METIPKTIVFFDLETTGFIPGRKFPDNIISNEEKMTYLFSQDFDPNYPSITEISMVAFNFEDFKNTNPSQAPNIFKRKSVIVNPNLDNWTEYDSKVAKITHLPSSILKTKQPFNIIWTNEFIPFIESLLKPIVIIAHNGFNFDFLLLQNELKRHNHQNSIENMDIRWLDTLIEIPKFDQTFSKNINEMLKDVRKCDANQNFANGMLTPEKKDSKGSNFELTPTTKKYQQIVSAFEDLSTYSEHKESPSTAMKIPEEQPENHHARRQLFDHNLSESEKNLEMKQISDLSSDATSTDLSEADIKNEFKLLLDSDLTYQSYIADAYKLKKEISTEKFYQSHNLQKKINLRKDEIRENLVKKLTPTKQSLDNSIDDDERENKIVKNCQSIISMQSNAIDYNKQVIIDDKWQNILRLIFTDDQIALLSPAHKMKFQDGNECLRKTSTGYFFTPQYSNKTNGRIRPPYSLGKIYERVIVNTANDREYLANLVNADQVNTSRPLAHSAEGDCWMMVRVCQQYTDDFYKAVINAPALPLT